jgi:exopolysaccharide biosynthesis polyprenyl glycosylphosphotransferase
MTVRGASKTAADPAVGPAIQMTEHVATRLRIHEPPPTGEVRSRRRAAPAPADASPQLGLPGIAGQVEVDAGAPPSLLWREALNRRMLAIADILAASLALVIVFDVPGTYRGGLAALAGMPLVLCLFKVAGLYDRDQLRLVHSTLDEVPLLVQLTGLFALVVTILQPLLLTGRLGAVQIAGLWLVTFAAIVTGRMLARTAAGRLATVERCLVIGETAQVRRIREKLAAARARARVVASLPLAGEEADRLGIDTPDAMRRAAADLHVHRIIVAPTTSDASDVVKLIRAAKGAGVRVSVLPRMLEAIGSAVEFDDIDGMPMLGVRCFGLSRSSVLLKRAFDLAGSLGGLLVVGPAIALIAVAIRLDSSGPVFFRQVRVGRDGKHFRIYKFRSMVADADGRKDALRARNEAGAGLFKIADDPRVTRVGRFLRATSLDELPQVLNVLRGEMSLVGPRPLVTDEDALVLGLDRSRLHLTPGMTGPWQVLGARVPMQEMVGIDYLYVANWSLWQDLKILVRTARHVARRGNV